MNILDLYMEDVGGDFVKKAGRGEWQGPCPLCGGDDRFCVYPEQGEGDVQEMGSFFCGHGRGGNGCNKGGDIIQYLRDVRGLSFKEACQMLGIEIRGGDSYQYQAPTAPRSARKDVFVPRDLSYPAEVVDAELWRAKGMKFVEACHQALLEREKTIEYLAGRGISMVSIEKYKLGFHGGQSRNGQDYEPSFRPWPSWGLRDEKKDNGRSRMLALPAGLVIPYLPDGVLHRLTIRMIKQDNYNPKKKYHYVVGSIRDVWMSNPEAQAHVVLEAELDCIAVDEVVGDLVGTIGIGGTGVKPEIRAAAALDRSLCILDSLDNDAAGEAAGQWWRETYQQCKCWPVPEAKDPGEYFEAGGDLRTWVMAGLPSVLVPDDVAGQVEEKLIEDESTSGAGIPEVGSSVSERSDLDEFRQLLYESGGFFRLYGRGIGLCTELPDDWKHAHPKQAYRFRELLYESDQVGDMILELSDGLYNHIHVPGRLVS